jgi:NADPH-dependent curcumin reductase CurA
MKRIVLSAVPQGMPKTADFQSEDAEVPECPARGLLVRTQWISVDPYLRGRISGQRTYVDPIRVGEVMESGAVGVVSESDNAAFRPGEIVVGNWGWQEIAAVGVKGLLKLNPDEAPVSTALGILGMPGMTAYFGLLELCNPQPGETVVISGAAGAVGSAAGQIAKILGCRVIGTAGSEQKLAYLRSLGFDGVLNYRSGPPYETALKQLCPAGIDCYFDNTGGELTDAVINQMNVRGRIAVCGQISQYNDRGSDVGPRPFWPMIVKQLRAEGFLVFRWSAEWPEARRKMAQWLREGKLQYRETVYEGLENAPTAFIGLFKGENIGKSLVKLDVGEK